MNFSLDWLYNTQPITTDGSSDSMDFYCPRCFFNKGKTSKDDPESLSTETNILEYIYRFWFILKDEAGSLKSCLLEAKTAEHFVNSIKARDFFSKEETSRRVYKVIHEKINKSFIFTFETYKLNETNANNYEENLKNPLKTLYKIVDIQE